METQDLIELPDFPEKSASYSLRVSAPKQQSQVDHVFLVESFKFCESRGTYVG